MKSRTAQGRILIWDFDGTLADTLRHALMLYNRLAEEHGYRMIDDPESVRGMTMREFLRSHNVPAYRIPFLFTRFLSAMKSATEVPRLYPGIADAVKRLSDAGYRHGIVSSNDTDNINRCLEYSRLSGRFESVCGTSRLFGKERRLKRTMREFDAGPSDCLYLGDEVRDIDAAKACDIPVASVTWGLNSRDVLSEHHPALIVDDVGDLPEHINRWFASRAECSNRHRS